MSTPRWLVCMGDSMTNTESTLGIPEAEQYPHLTARAVGGLCRPRNLGVPGDSTGQMLARVEAMLDPVPTVALFWGGINDHRLGMTDTETRQNLTTMIDTVRRAGCTRIMLLNIHRMREAEVDARYLSKRGVIRALARDQSLALCDLYEELHLEPADYNLDGLHLTPSGLARVAAVVAAQLERLGWGAVLRAQDPAPGRAGRSHP